MAGVPARATAKCSVRWLWLPPLSDGNKPLFGKGLTRTGFEISLQLAGHVFAMDRNIGAQRQRAPTGRGDNAAVLMRLKATFQIVCRANIDVAIAQLQKIDIPQCAAPPGIEHSTEARKSIYRLQSPCAATQLRETPFALTGRDIQSHFPQRFARRVACHPKPVRAKGGAPEEIRTPDPQIRSLVLYPAELRVRILRARTYWGAFPKASITVPAWDRGATQPQIPCKSQWKRADFGPKRHCGPLSLTAPLVKTPARSASRRLRQMGLGLGARSP